MTTPNPSCTTSSSLVGWTWATATSGATHTLANPVTVSANGNLTVTLTNAATMGAASPTACASSYFSMPSLTGVTATSGAPTATPGPTTDA